MRRERLVMSSPEHQQAIGRALADYVATSDEDAPAAWGRLRSILQEPQDSLIIADAARGAHQALEQEVQARQELIEAIEGGPNNLLPVLACIDDIHYVVSVGNGVYQRVGVMPPEDGAPALLSPAEFEERGPALAALDSSGSVIVDIYWLDEHADLFRLVLGGDEGRVISIDGGADDARPDAQQIPLALEADGS